MDEPAVIISVASFYQRRVDLLLVVQVVFLEHDWNPMNDLQAMDRAHRIGTELARADGGLLSGLAIVGLHMARWLLRFTCDVQVKRTPSMCIDSSPKTRLNNES